MTSLSKLQEMQKRAIEAIAETGKSGSPLTAKDLYGYARIFAEAHSRLSWALNWGGDQGHEGLRTLRSLIPRDYVRELERVTLELAKAEEAKKEKVAQ